MTTSDVYRLVDLAHYACWGALCLYSMFGSNIFMGVCGGIFGACYAGIKNAGR